MISTIKDMCQVYFAAMKDRSTMTIAPSMASRLGKKKVRLSVTSKTISLISEESNFKSKNSVFGSSVFGPIYNKRVLQQKYCSWYFETFFFALEISPLQAKTELLSKSSVLAPKQCFTPETVFCKRKGFAHTASTRRILCLQYVWSPGGGY